MPYPALPDRRMPYDNDGTVAYQGGTGQGSFANWCAAGPQSVIAGSTLIEMNDQDSADPGLLASENSFQGLFFFFPELREVTAFAYLLQSNANYEQGALQGSVDSTNGMDGTWETASLGSGFSYVWANIYQLDGWRAQIKPISFTGGKKALRLAVMHRGSFSQGRQIGIHWYGEKVAGQTPDDIVFIDHDTTPGAEYTADEDFGDRPLATSVVRQFRVKNVSATKTANNINLQCNDSDFAISSDNSTWVVTINLASLAAGAESATLYVRNTTPGAGGQLGPRAARIVGIVGSWS